MTARALAACLLLLGSLALGMVSAPAAWAGTSATSTALLSHRVLSLGQSQTLSVVARDLAGNPLAGARGRATVKYAGHTESYGLPKTDGQGRTQLTFRPPHGMTRGTGVVSVLVTNGYLDISLSATFSLQSTASTARGTATPGLVEGTAVPRTQPSGTAVTRTPTPRAQGTRTPTSHTPTPRAQTSRTPTSRTPTPTPTADSHSSPSSLVVVTNVFPPIVSAPEPAWISVYVHSKAGVVQPGASVQAIADFAEGPSQAVGTTDADGATTLRLDTSIARGGESVPVRVLVRSGKESGSGSATLNVSLATPTPTALPTPTPTATPLPASDAGLAPSPTPTPTPTATSGLYSLPSPIATDTPAPTVFPTPTQTPALPSVGSLPPTDTTVPTPTMTVDLAPTPTPTSTPTATVVPNCPGSQAGCTQAMLNIINDTRAKYGLAPYTLNATQSAGTASCIGSYGHSVHMAQVGYISHDQFPADICVSVSAAAENVGMMGSGNELQDLQGIHSEMMSEPYTPGCTGSHVCNLLSSQYRHVGIGIYYVNNATWLTENFLNP